MGGVTTLRGNRYPFLSDTADVPRDVQNLATDLDNAPIFASGLATGRPVSTGGSPGKVGRKYYSTDAGIDKGVLEFDYGQGYRRVALHDTTGVLSVSDAIVSTSGIATGQMTTTARDALATGHRPPSLIIYNTTTGQYEYNAGSDSIPNWQPLGAASVPIGGVMDWPWPAANIPTWAVLPYGQLLTQAVYPAFQIFADTVGRTYGGVAATNANLPDYRGRIGAGKDDMGGTAANRITVAVSGINGAALGVAGGTEGVTLTTAQLPAHNHGITGTPGISDPTHAHGGVITTGSASAAGGGADNNNSGSTGFASTGISVSAGSLGTSNSGSGSAHQNVQPTIIVNKIMRVI